MQSFAPRHLMALAAYAVALGSLVTRHDPTGFMFVGIFSLGFFTYFLAQGAAAEDRRVALRRRHIWYGIGASFGAVAFLALPFGMAAFGSVDVAAIAAGRAGRRLGAGHGGIAPVEYALFGFSLLGTLIAFVVPGFIHFPFLQALITMAALGFLGVTLFMPIAWLARSRLRALNEPQTRIKIAAFMIGSALVLGYYTGSAATLDPNVVFRPNTIKAGVELAWTFISILLPLGYVFYEHRKHVASLIAGKPWDAIFFASATAGSVGFISTTFANATVLGGLAGFADGAKLLGCMVGIIWIAVKWIRARRRQHGELQASAPSATPEELRRLT